MASAARVVMPHFPCASIASPARPLVLSNCEQHGDGFFPLCNAPFPLWSLNGVAYTCNLLADNVLPFQPASAPAGFARFLLGASTG